MKEKTLEYILMGIGVLLIGIGVYVFNKGETKDQIEIPETRYQISDKKTIFVDVAGEVNTPGVYSLILGARVGEAIASAGGVTDIADKDWVAQNLNQAKVLADGEKIYVPSIKSQTTSPNDQTISNTQITNSKININSASDSELDKLPGVGPVTAQKIINNRPYAKIEELTAKKVVSEKIYEQIKDLITAW